ncbi:MAG: helix-turn-helix domain-containing protein [Candidatus Hydrogenedentes bacterium]|nr:helix-turn-helix domain-containing protein [Candidatus Hydrogenedentota bacterium]
MNIRLLTEKEACQYLNVSRSFLARSRMEGRREGRTPGPPYIKINTAIRYSFEDLSSWLKEHRQEVR